MRASDQIPMVDLDVLGTDPEARLQVWSDLTRALSDLAPLNWRGAEGLIHYRSWLLDRVALSDVAIAPHVMERRTIHQKKYNKAFVIVRMHMTGQTSSEVGADAYTTRPGDLNIVDFTELYSGVATRTRALGAIIPHDAIGFDPTVHPAHIHVPPQGPAGAELAATFYRLARSLPTATLQEANAAARHFRDLLRAFLERFAERAQSEQDPTVLRRKQMRAVLEKSLRSPDLSATTLEDEFGVSRATVYRDLDSLGGLQHYVMRRRIEEACKELVFGPDFRGVIGSVAERWRFSSTAHFSREFRRHFGFSPSKAVASVLFRMTPDDPRVMGQETGSGAPAWLKNL